jgi:selT/selW/selH-like putative selenoprotein
VVELEGKFGNKLHCTLHRGDGGAFEVFVDGERVFSKLGTGRFPARGEIAGAGEPRLRGARSMAKRAQTSG